MPTETGRQRRVPWDSSASVAPAYRSPPRDFVTDCGAAGQQGRRLSYWRSAPGSNLELPGSSYQSEEPDEELITIPQLIVEDRGPVSGERRRSPLTYSSQLEVKIPSRSGWGGVGEERRSSHLDLIKMTRACAQRRRRAAPDARTAAVECHRERGWENGSPRHLEAVATSPSAQCARGEG